MGQPGTVLTAAIIERLQNLGIDSVFVDGPEPAGTKPLKLALQELDQRFEGHEQNTWMMKLKAVVARQLEAKSPPDHD
jgi:hypothetical protein